MAKKNNNQAKKLKKTNIILIVSLCIAVSLFALTGVLYGLSMARTNKLSLTLENVYQKNYYELVDNVNNAEIKLSKALASSDDDYTKKMLYEVSKHTARASTNLAGLPISVNGLQETINFVNKVDGYTTSLYSKLDNGSSLTDSDYVTLSSVHDSITQIKAGLTNFSEKMNGGYNILESSLDISGDYNSFTNSMGDVSTDIDYPSMIYDGPFSDSTISKEVVGLNFDEISESDARAKLLNYFDNLTNENIEYLGETAGQFSTYDYSIKLNDDTNMFVQLTKKGGKLLNVSGYTNNISTTVSLTSAINTGKAFLERLELANFDCVWSDIIGGCAFLNFAPLKNNVVLYPDLIKVKVELGEGKIIGYDAVSYYTNHTERTLEIASYGAVNAREKISSDFKIQKERLVLAPLEYNREVLCYEFECSKDGATYYFYFNAENGKEENILKVVETDNGNLLM